MLSWRKHFVAIHLFLWVSEQFFTFNRCLNTYFQYTENPVLTTQFMISLLQRILWSWLTSGANPLSCPNTQNSSVWKGDVEWSIDVPWSSLISPWALDLRWYYINRPSQSGVRFWPSVSSSPTDLFVLYLSFVSVSVPAVSSPRTSFSWWYPQRWLCSKYPRQPTREGSMSILQGNTVMVEWCLCIQLLRSPPKFIAITLVLHCHLSVPSKYALKDSLRLYLPWAKVIYGVFLTMVF